MVDPHHHSDGECEEEDLRDPMTRRDWERLPADPDLHDDLGYELIDTESYEADGDRTVFLPSDEDMLREDSFIVVSQEDIHTPGGAGPSRRR